MHYYVHAHLRPLRSVEVSRPIPEEGVVSARSGTSIIHVIARSRSDI